MENNKHGHGTPFYPKPLVRAIIALVPTLALAMLHCHPVLKFALMWLMFASVSLALDWYIIVRCNAHQMRKLAATEDGGRIYVSTFVLLCALASLLNITLLIKNEAAFNMPPLLFHALFIATVLLTWALIHTLYTLHYARMYYRDEKSKPLDFPNEPAPDYLDFAYFGFGIGATCQTADVSLRSKPMRRVVLFHSTLSFLINGFIIALTINIISGTLGK